MMFAVILTYKKPLEEVEELTPAHRAFLDQYYQAGVLLLSGRQTPPQGGVILAKAKTKEILMEILSQDPFYQADVADYAVYEFVPTKFQPILKDWLEAV